MANIGEYLPTPEAGWVRYEDTDSIVAYSTDWVHSGADPAYTGSGMSYTYTIGATATVTFIGVGIRIISYGTVNHSNSVTYTIDGIQSIVSHSDIGVKVVSYEALNLTNTQHVLTIVNNTDKAVVLDAMDISIIEIPEVNCQLFTSGL